MKRLIICLYILFSALHLTAGEQYIYTKISNQNGLASTVNCIYKEKDGAVWLGTPRGLYSFNGYNIKHFNDSLFFGRAVYDIEEDIKGGIWILTDSWIMHRKKGEEAFKVVGCGEEKETPSFMSMCQDEEGLWFGGVGCIYRYTYKEEQLSYFCSLGNRYCSIINKAGISTLMCSSSNGSILEKAHPDVFNIMLQLLDDGRLTDSKGRLWIACYNHGIRVYEKDWTVLRSYSTGNSSLSSDLVICLTEKDGKIWAGTDGGGINVIDLENDKLTVLSYIPGDSSSFPAHSIKSIYTDNYGNIWAGSTRDGLIKVSPSGMKTYSDSHIGLSDGMTNHTVLCLFQEDNDDAVWIGTDGDGINRFDPKTNEFTHYWSTANSKVVSITDFSKDELALSIYSEGILIFNKHSGKTRPLTIKDDDLIYKLRYTSRSIGLTCEPDGNILVLCKTIKRLDPHTGRSQQVDIGGNPLNNDIHTIGKTPTGIWAHDSRRIFFMKYGATATETSGTLEESIIRSGYICDKGLIWLATDNGLYCFDPALGKFTHISTSLFSNATSVVCDRNSRIWVGTELDVFAYLTESESFAMFGESDGAQPNEYLSKPRLLSREGDVYMGGVFGLLRIDRNYTIEKLEIPRLELNEILIDGQILGDPDKGVYHVPHHSYSMTINVATQEKDIFRNKMYRFSFSNGGPVFEKAAPTVNIRQLPPPGRYVISVSCTKRNGNWTQPVEIATIRIQRPWYLSGWFIGGSIFLILAITGTILLLVAYRKTNRLQLALKEQEQRMYEEKVRMLNDIDRIKSQL